MVDLSKHIARMKQATERRQWDLAIEVGMECQEVDPINLEIYKLLVEAAKRKAKESGKKGMLGGLGMPSFSKDPHKQLSQAIKKLSQGPDVKTFAAAGDAALKVHQTGLKAIADVAILLYEEVRSTGLFNPEVLWNLANLYYSRFQQTKDADALEKALKTMAELERAMPNHPEAARSIKNWEAMRSMTKRANAAGSSSGGDYRSQLSSEEKTRRQDAMNRIIRTIEDANEVIKYIVQDLAETPADKSLWMKKGDIHRQFRQFDEARAAFQKVVEIDQYDFVAQMRLGDVTIAEGQQKIKDLETAGQDITAAKQELLLAEIQEYRKRVERQPTEMGHHFSLGQKLYASGNIEAAASEFQQTMRDPRFKKPSYRLLGACFTRKKLPDLAIQQYEAFLKLTEDDMADDAKEVRYALARLQEDTGRREDAAGNFQRLVEVDLGFKDAADRLSALRAK
jgi:tetratricopeptide (TPR) repeat protein